MRGAGPAHRVPGSRDCCLTSELADAADGLAGDSDLVPLSPSSVGSWCHNFLERGLPPKLLSTSSGNPVSSCTSSWGPQSPKGRLSCEVQRLPQQGGPGRGRRAWGCTRTDRTDHWAPGEACAVRPDAPGPAGLWARTPAEGLPAVLCSGLHLESRSGDVNAVQGQEGCAWKGGTGHPQRFRNLSKDAELVSIGPGS